MPKRSPRITSRPLAPAVDPLTTDKPSLCYRCEHRATFLERGHGPRYECHLANSSRAACYCYLPVRPCVLAKLNESDPRPAGSGLFAARSRAVGVACCRVKAKGTSERWTMEQRGIYERA